MIAGAIAFLVARGLTSLVANLIVFGVLAALVTGAGVYVHHEWDKHVLEPARVEGDQRTAKKLQPQIDALEKKAETAIGERDAARSDLKTALDANGTLLARIEGKGGLVEQIATSKKSVARWQAVADQLRATNAALAKKLDDQIEKSKVAVDRAKAIATGPVAVSFDQACRDADRIMSDLARRMHEAI